MIGTLIEELREMPNGTEITLANLIRYCGYEVDENDLWNVYDDLCKAAQKAHISLDWSAYNNMIVGLPYNIPFVVKNKKAQIKCPYCGGRNTARIIYGLPIFDEDLESKINEGKIHLGGCCVSEFSATRFCNKCKKSFGALPKLIMNNKVELMMDMVE